MTNSQRRQLQLWVLAVASVPHATVTEANSIAWMTSTRQSHCLQEHMQQVAASTATTLLPNTYTTLDYIMHA